jgi:hypothetical protein
MSGLKENGMSNGEVLAAMNKIHNQKSRTLKIFPQVSWLRQGSLTHIWFSRLSSNKENKVDGYKT